MKRRLLLILSALMLLTALCTSGALAADGTYEVDSVADWNEAIYQITSSAEDSATIVLTDDVDLGDVNQIGVEGKSITIRSQGNDPFLLTTKEETVVYGEDTWVPKSNTEGSIYLLGDVKFENVHTFANRIYAQGHKLVLGKGFAGEGVDEPENRMMVFGGNRNDNLTADTHIEIYDGLYKLIAGGNASGTLNGSTYVKFGGDARFPTALDGKGENDTSTGSDEGHNLYQAMDTGATTSGVISFYTKRGHIPYGIYGGGIDADTTGSTKVEMTGGEVYQIFGGGAATWNPEYKEDNFGDGFVEGDTYEKAPTRLLPGNGLRTEAPQSRRRP